VVTDNYRVLVTGGAGFIGSHIVDALVDAGADVVVLDSLSRSAHALEPAYLNQKADLRHVALSEIRAVRSAVDGVDAVCHQAARVGLGLDFDDVTRYVNDNDMGTATLLRALFHRGFTGRLVVASSMVVYGEGRYKCEIHGDVRPLARSVDALNVGLFEPSCPHCHSSVAWAPITEDAILDPRSVYAATKLHTEHLAFAFARESGASVAALRYHNVYGPRMPRDTPYAGVAGIFRSQIEAGQPPQVFEDGGQTRDFVHVSDVARANLAALTAPATGPFNIASGRPHTVFELAAALCRTTNGGAPVINDRFRLGDVRHIVASPARAAERLGFEAVIGFEDGVAEFANAPLRSSIATA
jgi:dTDP-L-rhamnose 4-epimerase